MSRGLWNVVWLGADAPKGSATDSTTGGREPSIDRSEVKDAIASTIIMGLCTQATLQHILLLATAKEQWDTLKSLYSPLGLQQLSAKIQAFTAYRPTEGSATITEISTHLSTLQYEIGAIDPSERPSDTLKISILLQAVRASDPRYGPLILQLEINDSVKDYGAIVSHLTEFERRMGPKEALKETVLSARTGNKEPRRRFQGKCYNCQKPGHKSTECRSKRPVNSPTTGPLATPGGRQGLTPPPTQPNLQANTATEVSWLATTKPKDRGELLWIVDSGCSRHMTFYKEAFTDYRLLEEPILVNTASGASIQAIAEGTVVLNVTVGGTARTVTLSGVLHVPRLAGSLISVLQLQDRGITVRTTVGPEGKKLLIELQGAIVGEASRLGRSYALNSPEGGTSTVETSLKATDEESSVIWHRRFGHLSGQSLQHLHTVTTGLSKPITAFKDPCEACILTKKVRVINRNTPERATEPLQRIHTDFWGLYSEPTLKGESYILTFTDDYTRKSWVYITRSRDQLHTMFIQFKTLVELESGYRIKVVRCDNAPEYRRLGGLISQDYGVTFEYTTTYTPEQNGVSKRLNRSLITMARAMLLDSKLPTRFWGEAVTTACYIRNRTPIGPGGKTPEEAYSGKRPYIGHLRAYGCIAYAHIPIEKRQKLESTAQRTCLIGYMPTSRQYRLYHPETGQIIVSTAPTFDENKRLEWDWNEDLPGELTTPFDPMGAGAVIEPKSPVNPGTNTTSHNPRNLGGDLGNNDPNDTIVVDLGPGEGTATDDQGAALGLEGPDDPEDPEQQEVTVRRSGRTRTPTVRYQAYSATTDIIIPKPYAEAIADPSVGSSVAV